MERGKYYYFFFRFRCFRLEPHLIDSDLNCANVLTSGVLFTARRGSSTPRVLRQRRQRLNVSSVDASYFPERMLSVAHHFVIIFLSSAFVSLFFLFFFFFYFSFIYLFIYLFFCCCSHDNVTINRIVDALVTSRETTKAR